MNGTETAIFILLDLINRAAEVSALINKARAEKRDVTDEELDQFSQADDEARDKLWKEINRQRASGS